MTKEAEGMSFALFKMLERWHKISRIAFFMANIGVLL
jgi:hypothetical protein